MSAPRFPRALLAPLLAAVACVALLAACAGEEAELEGAAPELPAPAVATHVVIDGQLDRGTMALLTRAVRHAEGADHQHLLVELDTPGGEIMLMWQLAKTLREASEDGLLTVVWVNGNATSAGSLLAIAAERLFMRGASTIGSATPVTFGPEGMQEAPEKVRSLVRSQFRAIAEELGRSPALAEAMVDPEVAVYEVRTERGLELVTGDEWDDLRMGQDVPELVRTVVARGELLNLTGPEAVQLGLADGIAESLDELLSDVGCTGCVAETLERRPSEDGLALLAQLSPLLLLAALWLGYTELKAPGFGLPGILALGCLGVALLGQYLVGLADVPHLVLVGAGVVLVVVELFFVPGTIWIGLLGGVCIAAGVVMAQLGPGFTLGAPLDQKLLLDVAFRLVLMAIAGMAGAWALSRFLPDVPVLRRLILSPSSGGPSFGEALPEARTAAELGARPGAPGVAETPLRPVGRVVLDASPDRVFEARAEGEWIAERARVRVLEVHGGRLVVAPDADGTEENDGTDETARADAGAAGAEGGRA